MSEQFDGFTCPDPMMAGREDRCCLFSFSWRCPAREIWERDLVKRATGEAIERTAQRGRFKLRRQIVIEYRCEDLSQAQSFDSHLASVIAGATVVQVTNIKTGDRP
jgi:hypothetical protein